MKRAKKLSKTICCETLRSICLESGADDAGIIEIARPGISAHYNDIVHAFPGAVSIISIIKKANRQSIQSPMLSLANEEYRHIYNVTAGAGRKIICRLNELGINGVSVPAGFPMEMDKFPAKIWIVGHKEVAVEAGLGRMGLNRLVLHPRFGAHIVLGSIITDAECERYGEPLTEDPCLHCNLCAAVCPTGAVNANGPFDFMACATHNYREMFGGWQDWIETLTEAESAKMYRSMYRDPETMTKWQALTKGDNYRCSYCMAVCPAGAEMECLFNVDKRAHKEKVFDPLKHKKEPVYVRAGTRSEKIAKGNPDKTVRIVRETMRPTSIAAFKLRLPLLFKTERAKGLDLNFHFTFRGKEPLEMTVQIKDSEIKISDGHAGNPTLKVKADSETWIDFLNERISLFKAIISMKLLVIGSPLQMRKFDRCFR